MNGNTHVAVNASMALAMVAGFIWVGTVDADVENLKKDTIKIEQVQRTVQATSVKVARMEVRQEALKEDVEDVNDKLDRLIEAVEDIE